MIVLINGPFGIGKTTTARELLRIVPETHLFDPELVGGFLRLLLGPIAPHDDFQDLPLWRSLTVDLASRVHENYGLHLIMPMTIWRRDYFEEITGGLRDREIDVACFRLIASRETITQRILGRPESDGPHGWCLSHLDAGLAAANDPAFGAAIETDGRTPDEIAKEIACALSR